ncbi:O-antigen ligase family protein [Aurantimonas sp. Leaf443]|uniref:O-antigen ligase family protein n=1 Tax=Aurantimonas sp. Leaf443 TaxID=1736378 RepID=UPI0006F8C3F7|nr:O-antigen ligase family protein [Aurantimonas sp. Leaf443]KQT85073.1 hypothetical protein ASG48_07230 [Aurantimonas sp. Leaf443]
MMQLIARQIGPRVFLAVVILAPLLFGSATVRSIAFLLALSALALLLAPAPSSRRLAVLLALSGSAFVMFALFSSLQLTFAFGLVGFDPIALVDEARSLLLPVPGGPAFSLDASLYPETMMRALLATLVFWNALLYGQDRNRALASLNTMVVATAIMSALTIALFVADPSRVLWREKVAYFRDFTGPFVHRGAAGAWLCLLGISAALLLVRALDHLLTHFVVDDASLPKRLLLAFFAEPIRLTFLATVTVLTVAGLLLTQSRTAGLVFGFNILGLVAILFMTRLGSTRATVAIAVTVLTGFALMFAAAGSGLRDRLADTSFFEEGRWEIWGSTLRAILDRPILGFGAGTFRDLFPLFRSEALASLGPIQKAHSLPLEIASESGLPIAVLLCGLWLGISVYLLAGLLRATRFDALRSAGVLAAFSAIPFVSIDVIYDTFGYVAPLLAIVGLALAQPESRAPRS